MVLSIMDKPIRTLLETYMDKLKRVELERHKTINDLDCALFMAHFNQRVKKILDHSSGSIVSIPFPKGCGQPIKEILDQNEIINFATMNEPLHQKNRLVIIVDIHRKQFKGLFNVLE